MHKRGFTFSAQLQILCITVYMVQNAAFSGSVKESALTQRDST